MSTINNFSAEKAISMGMDKNVAVWLVSTTGLTNTFGRVICGWISSYESIDPILVNNVSLTFGGLYTVLLPLLPYSVFSYYLYASLFGFSMGEYSGFTHIDHFYAQLYTTHTSVVFEIYGILNLNSIIVQLINDINRDLYFIRVLECV